MKEKSSKTVTDKQCLSTTLSSVHQYATVDWCFTSTGNEKWCCQLSAENPRNHHLQSSFLMSVVQHSGCQKLGFQYKQDSLARQHHQLVGCLVSQTKHTTTNSNRHQADSLQQMNISGTFCLLRPGTRWLADNQEINLVKARLQSPANVALDISDKLLLCYRSTTTSV